MLNTLLFFTHYAILLFFGILLSFAFGGVRLSIKRNITTAVITFIFCGIIQLGVFLLFDEDTVWQVYPLIAHLPTCLLITLFYRKKLATALAAVSSAYLCCQPAKWVGVLISAVSKSYISEIIARIATLFVMGYIVLKFLAPYLSKIFNKDTRSVCIFGFIPVVYYLFDYTMSIYTDFWVTNNRIAVEFLPFFLCIVFMLFCFVYYKEYEQKADAERKEQIVRITAEQQAKEIESVKRSEREIRLLRHDMRLILSSLAACIEDGKTDSAREIISSYTARVEGTKTEHYCNNDIINYVISDFAAKCKAEEIIFSYAVAIDSIKTDDILFSSILSNALDNALNAQKDVPKEQRNISLMLKTIDGKLLLSVKNPVSKPPAFADGFPVSNKKGHGHGTQSIRYTAERLGGNCQFSVQNNTFITRVII